MNLILGILIFFVMFLSLGYSTMKIGNPVDRSTDR